MRIIVIGAPELVRSLAAHLHLEQVHRIVLNIPDRFVIDGTELRLTSVRALDLLLRTRAAEVDAVLWLRGGDPAVLEHYRGRVIDLNGAADTFEAALDGLREVLLAP